MGAHYVFNPSTFYICCDLFDPRLFCAKERYWSSKHIIGYTQYPPPNHSFPSSRSPYHHYYSHHKRYIMSAPMMTRRRCHSIEESTSEGSTTHRTLKRARLSVQDTDSHAPGKQAAVDVGTDRLSSFSAELRNQIMLSALVEDQPIRFACPPLSSKSVPHIVEPGILRTCKSIRNEALIMFYANNTFTRRIESHEQPIEALKGLRVAFESMGATKRSMLKEVRIEFPFDRVDRTFLMQWAELFSGSAAPPPGVIRPCNVIPPPGNPNYRLRSPSTTWDPPSAMELEWYDVLFARMERIGRQLVNGKQWWQSKLDVEMAVVQRLVCREMRKRYNERMNPSQTGALIQAVSDWACTVTGFARYYSMPLPVRAAVGGQGGMLRLQ